MEQRRLHSGMTLIELMVALAIGGFLMIGAVTVFMQSRTTFRITESVSRLQENGRFALDALEPDIRMSHYWGLTSRSSKINGRATPTQAANAIAPATCGNNWVVDLGTAVAGTNNRYGWACPGNATVEARSDTLVVRRVSEAPIPGAPLPDTVYIQSARYQESQLFRAAAIPPLFVPATSATHQLIVNGYYVSRNSTLDTPGNAVPSLRMKTLVRGPAIQDQEVLPGVEDMQIQFGVDTDLPKTANRGSIDRYVNPEAPILNPANAAFLPDAEILAVRIWLRLRAERLENGFVDTTNYVYADQNFTPDATNNMFRRIVVSKTIYLRNARRDE